MYASVPGTISSFIPIYFICTAQQIKKSIFIPGYKYDANSHNSLQVNSSNGSPLRLIRNPGHLAPGRFRGGDMVPGIIFESILKEKHHI